MESQPPDERPIARLRRLAGALARLELPHPADAAWLVVGAARYEAATSSGMTLDLGAALGLGVPGRRGWWSDERRARRDDLLRELRARHYGELTPGRAAAAIYRLAMRVQAGGAQMADADDRAGFMVEVLTTGLPVPGVRQLARLLDISSTI